VFRHRRHAAEGVYIRNRAKDQAIDPRCSLASNLFEDVVKNFIDVHAKKNLAETQRIFDRYVLPQWDYKSIDDTREVA
jgi:hypothetical protein